MKTIEFASAIKVEELQSEVDELLRAIAKYMVEPGESVDEWMTYVFVSDESCLGDFLSRDTDVESLAEGLKLPQIRRSDRVYELAAILRQRELPT